MSRRCQKCRESNGVAEKVLHSSVSVVNSVGTFRVLLALAVSVFFIFLHFFLHSAGSLLSGEMSELVSGITECVRALLFQEGKLV